MGENATKIGAKLEGWGSSLFQDFCWTELARDLEIKCNRKATHEDKQTHGIDLLFSLFDPYLKLRQGIIVECKNRQMQSINQTEINKWIQELQNSIECAHGAPELEHMLSQVELSTGLLLIHANDSFNGELFAKYLRNAKMKLKRNKMSIYVASNDEIDRWQSLITYIKTLGEDFRFHYPSINESNIENNKQITLNYLFSRYIFAETIEYKSQTMYGKQAMIPVRRRIVFIFDKPSIESFRYVWSMSKHFQFNNGEDQITYAFYPSTPENIKFTKDNFFNSIMNDIDHPMTAEIRAKSNIEFLRNRHISPVEY